MEVRVCIFALFVVLLGVPAAFGTPPTPPVTTSVSGDATLGGTVLLDVTARSFMAGRAIELVVDPQVRVEGPVMWTPSKDDLKHQWRITVVGTGFWRASLATSDGVLDAPCCIVAWSGPDSGVAWPAAWAHSAFAGHWHFPNIVTAKATPLNDTWIRLDVTVITEDPRLEGANFTTTVHGQDGASVTLDLPERGRITSIHQTWWRSLPDPVEGGVPLRIGGTVACRSADLDWTPSRDVEVTLQPCPVLTGVPGASAAGSIAAVSFALAIAGFCRLRRR